jgi:DNA repair protein RecN (Recombination protein N)
MLSLIRVKNYAIIDEVEVELPAGFSVMTGETGAGKSILVDALGLALGDRADAAAVRTGAERAEISVQFEGLEKNRAAAAWLEERDLDDGDQCTLRRVISSEGRSRAFINGQPVTLQDLKVLGGYLVDIHGQHEHQSLLESGGQRSLLDAYAGLEDLAASVASAFAAWQQAEEDLAARRSASTDRVAQLELLRFHLSELDALAPAEGEPASLRAERDRLANIDRLLTGVGTALQVLFEDETAAAYKAVVRARQELERLVTHDAALRAPSAQLTAIEIELRDIEATLNRYRDGGEADPARLEQLDERLAKFRSLARRHSCAEEELGATREALRARIAALDGGEESIDALAAKVARARQEFLALAAKLSAGRTKHAAKLGKAVTAQLAELGMPHGEFRVALERKPEERADGTGLERVDFEVRLNPGQAFGALAKVASGGELSRISLAIEVVRSGKSPVATFVFDEVDAGVGGRVAEIVGRKLSQLGANRQVLCVTHLPQVASQGQRHYSVAKLTDGKTSRTHVRPLSSKERIEELSRMLGGIEITDRTRAHAAEMIDRASK